MPPQLALFLCILFILWLLKYDPISPRNVSFSKALWIPVLWFAIIGSRPVTLWLGLSPSSGVDYLSEGTPFDRAFYLVLIGAGMVVLLKRRLDAGWVRANWCLLVFYAFLLLSTMWSLHPFVSFKRWIKDCGNIVMALLILTDAEPTKALQKVLLRCYYVLIPLSVVFIKYFPNLGRYFNRYVWTYSYGGVTLNKNLLGVTVFVFGFGLVWSYLEHRGPWRADARRNATAFVLGVMGLYLFVMANSKTALMCAVIAGVLVMIFRSPRFARLWCFPVVAAACLFCIMMSLQIRIGLVDSVIELMGRDATLTGRTEIWRRALDVDINPIIGVGYYSFWSGPWVERISQY